MGAPFQARCWLEWEVTSTEPVLWGLKRLQTGHSYFVTFSCYQRQPLYVSSSRILFFYSMAAD